jgi:hypothetical protein
MPYKLSLHSFKNVFKPITITTICFVVLCGILMLVCESKPFWLDEWFIIYNLKTKDAAGLWGELTFMQQFPRVYLQIIKFFTGAAGYSYISLRMPSFVVHVLAMICCYKLSGRLFKEQPIQKFLWVVLYIAFGTALEYYIQVKQYTMEMLLGLAGIWQLLELKQLVDFPEKRKGMSYILLCLSLLIAPFFSYTYPIVIAPVFVLLPVYALRSGDSKKLQGILLPLLIAILSIVAFYFADVKQVMQDKGMQNYWADYMLQNGFEFKTFFTKFFQMFANMGAGDLFGIISGIIGLAAFVYTTSVAIRRFRSDGSDTALVEAYAAMLVWVLLLLFATGKIPMGMHRLNAFATPALAYLIVSFLAAIGRMPKLKIASTVLTVFLFLGACGNVFSTYINQYTNPDEKKKLVIYRNMQKAIEMARTQHVPLLVTSSVCYPYTGQVPADKMLITYPAYKMQQPVHIYEIPDQENAKRLQDSLSIDHAVFTDGENMVMLKKGS